MAIFNEILEGRYNRALQKLFAIKGPPPVRQIGGEIMPTFSIFQGVENRFLESWNRFGANFSLVSVAAQITAFRFRNPSSNIVAVIEKLSMFDTTVAQQINIAIGSTAVDLLSGQSAGISLDRRQGQANSFNATMVLSGATNAPTLPATMILFSHFLLQVNIERDFMIFEDHEIPVLPGDALDFREQSIPGGEAIHINLVWRERAMTESELK